MNYQDFQAEKTYDIVLPTGVARAGRKAIREHLTSEIKGLLRRSNTKELETLCRDLRPSRLLWTSGRVKTRFLGYGLEAPGEAYTVKILIDLRGLAELRWLLEAAEQCAEEAVYEVEAEALDAIWRRGNGQPRSQPEGEALLK